MKFRDRVLAANPSIVHVPAGFKRYGHVMVLRSTHRLSQDLGRTILDLYGWCRSVYQHLTTIGQSRLPNLVLLAGDDSPQVVHRENGVSYCFDVTQITFSGGNRHLRERLVTRVRDGEYLIDMFAAVGNLSLQPLVHRKISGLLVERNPNTFGYLQSTLEHNGLDPGLAVNGDCRSLTQQRVADRILMGYHGVDRSHLTTALQLARSPAVLHLHPIVPENNWSGTLGSYQQIIEQLGWAVLQEEAVKVKSYAPGMDHIELIVTVSQSS